MSELRYQRLDFESRAATLASIAGGDDDSIVRAMFAAALESNDKDFIETLAVALSVHPAADVRRAAVLSLGHVARRFGTVEPASLEAVIARLRNDTDLRGALYDLESDLNVFIGRPHEDHD